MSESQRISEKILIAARALSNADQRAAYMDAVCGNDRQLRVEFEARIAANDGAIKKDPVAGDGNGATSDRETISQPISEAPGTVIGRYKLLQEIGQGGMGIVYLADQEKPVHRRVALKIIKPGMDSVQVIARFEQERQALAMMDHPNIAKVLDAGTTENGRPYFVMELVKGIPLTKYCDQQHLSPRERLELFIPVCRAVQHAHQKGIIHRDLKPSNVMVALYDGEPIAKVIDFGVAKATSQRLTERTMFTEIGSIIGTIEYMAPEQAELNNLDIDTRADIYSLGVILYELLTGAPPFSAKQLRSEAFTEMLRLIREVEPQKPSTRLSASAELPVIAANRKLDPNNLRKVIQGDLDWIVMRALEKDRNRRYETANAFASDIARYLNNEPVMAGPPTAGYRFRKFVSRHGHVLALAAMAFALLAVAATVSTWQALVARRANVVANQQRDAATDAERRARAERDRAIVAEKKAKDAAAQARTQAAIAAAVNDFLSTDLLGQASARKQGTPTTIPDPNLTVRTALDRAAQRVADRFEKQPDVEAAIRRTIGWSYRDLGDLAAAQSQFDAALMLLRRTRTPNNPELIDLTTDVAMMYRLRGKYLESESLLRQVIDEGNRSLGKEHPITLRALGALANALIAQGKPRDAEPLLKSLLEYERQNLGPEATQSLVSMNSLGNIYKDEAKYAQALEMYNHVLRVRVRDLGAEHPDTLAVMNNLAIVHKLKGEWDQAKKIYESVLESRRKILGNDHPNTLISVNNIALLLLDEARYVEAEKMIGDAIETAKQKLGEDHPMILNMMDNLAELHDRQGRHDQAQSLFEKVLEQRKRQLGEDHPDTLTTMHGLAIAQFHSGKLEDAEKNLLFIIETRKRIQGTDHPDLAAALAELGENRLTLKQYAQAEEPLREATQILKDRIPDDWRRFDTELLFGESLAGQTKFADAEPILISGYEGMQRLAATIPVHSRSRANDVVQRIVAIHEMHGDQGKADEWRKKLTK